MSSAPATPSPGPTTRQRLWVLLGLAWPIVVSRSTQVVVGLSDALMVTGLGEAGLAATTAGAFNAFAVLILPMGVAFIISSFSSQLFGSGDRAGARRYGYYGLGLALLTQAICLAGLPFIPRVLDFLPYAPDVRALMAGYLFWRLLSGGFAIGIEALANFYGGQGNTQLAMRISVLTMLLNIAGNWLLIEGHLGFPALGVRGAAIASSIATTLACCVFVVKFLRDGRGAPAASGLQVGEFLRMLRFGLPSGLNWFFEFFAFNFFINVVVAGLGTTALAALMSVMQVNSVSFMPSFALASAGAILVGQEIGASRPDEVPRLVRLTFSVAGTWQGLTALAYLALPVPLMWLFAPGSGGEQATFLAVASRMLMLSAAWQLFDAAATTLAESLRAAGDTAFTLWARLLTAWLVFVPGAWISVRYLGWGDVGALLWVVVYLALLALILLLRFRAGSWRDIQLIEPH